MAQHSRLFLDASVCFELETELVDKLNKGIMTDFYVIKFNCESQFKS